MFLFFQAGEYVSILIDNGTGSALTILRDSLFSGILIGVWRPPNSSFSVYVKYSWQSRVIA